MSVWYIANEIGSPYFGASYRFKVTVFVTGKPQKQKEQRIAPLLPARTLPQVLRQVRTTTAAMRHWRRPY